MRGVGGGLRADGARGGVHRGLLALVLLGCALGAAACGEAPADGDGAVLTASTAEVAPPAGDGLAGGFPPLREDPPRGGVLHAALADDIDCWNGLSWYGASWSVFGLMARGLYGQLDQPHAPADGQVRPELAQDMPLVSEDGLTWTVRLREGLRFPDGSAVDAGDVVATFQRLLDPAAQCASGGPPASGYYDGLAGYPAWAAARVAGDDAGALPGVRAVDALTVEFALRAPDPDFAYALALPWAFIHPADAAARDDGGPPPFVGPYRLVAPEPGERLVVEREPGWPANVAAGVPEAPWQNALDGVDLEIGVDEDLQLARLVTGALDVSLGPGVPHGPQIDRVATDPALAGRVFSTPAVAVAFAALRADRPPFDRLEARRAANLALDRSALARRAGGLLAGRAWGQVLPPGLVGDQPSEVYAFDPGRARMLARAAGAVGEQVVLVHGATGSETELARAVAADLAAAGFAVRRRALPGHLIAGILRDPAATWHVALVQWSGDYPDATAWLEPLLTCGGGANIGGWCDPDFDGRVGEAAALPPGAERDAQLAALATAVMADAAPLAPLLAPRHAALVSARGINYRWGPVYGPHLGTLAVDGPPPGGGGG